jgi:hypothetical protein
MTYSLRGKIRPTDSAGQRPLPITGWGLLLSEASYIPLSIAGSVDFAQPGPDAAASPPSNEISRRTVRLSRSRSRIPSSQVPRTGGDIRDDEGEQQ